MRPWQSRLLAALGPSFFILCAVLLWTVYRAWEGRLGPVPRWRMALFLVGAVLAFVMGGVATRERYRRMRRDD
jgi:4-amino-4-deoxy-L-arabinose transferase-like glycosyltransferase